MIQNNNLDSSDVNGLAEAMGVPFQIHVSPELSELLRPNDFMTGLGILYSERIKGILSILRGNLLPKNKSLKEAMPKGAIVFPLALAKGPFIREELITIKAEATDDDGEEGILLTAILEEE
jgi:hypothetical protein